ncbi:hypothetical protein Gotur_006234 [Gossypium turneri]
MGYSKDDWKSLIIHCKSATAQDLLQQEIYQLWTDRRRILAYYTGDIQENRDEKSLRLLKKIADAEIEDYPSHLLEQIRNIQKRWQPEKKEIHIPTTNIGNVEVIIKSMMKTKEEIQMQTKKVLQRGSYHQNNDDVSSDGSNYDTSSDGSGH